MIGAGEAFRIDTVGVNTPLVSESITSDGIFEPGEIWSFIIDDYLNFGGLPAHLLDSVGVASLSGGEPPSTGSIIAFAAVPELGTLLLLALSVLGVVPAARSSGSRGPG